MTKYFVYRIYCHENAKSYVGITKNVERRWRSHKKCALRGEGRALGAAIRKYGIDKFSLSVVAKTSSLSKLSILERKYIRKFNSLSPNGYNQTTGGDHNIGAEVCNRTKVKISQAITEFWKKYPEKLTSQARKRAERAWSNKKSRRKLLKALEKARSSFTEISRMKIRSSTLKMMKDPKTKRRMMRGWREYSKKYKGTKVLSDRTKRGWITRRRREGGKF